VYEKASSGGGEERELFKEPGRRHYVTSWSRDGRFLLWHTENTPRTGYDLWVLPLQGDRTPIRLLGETFNEWAGQFSPDMRWIAYASTETGEADVFVRPFRVSAQSGLPELGDGKWQVSKEAGNWPRWRNQREILFSDAPTGTAIFAASVRTAGNAFETDIPQRLFAARRASWDVTPDGRRLLLAAAQAQRTAQAPITVVVNWPALLKK